MLDDHQDAQGHDIYDYYLGHGSYEIIERDDGYLSISPGPALYFLQYRDWPESEQEAMRRVSGRVLDIGCGAGRHALYLQEQGFETVGVDISPRAIEVCRARGLRHTEILSITGISSQLGFFDTILLLGNNFALVRNPKRARWLLRRFDGMTSTDATIIAQTVSPYETRSAEHLAYFSRNREKGRLPGQFRLRVRYKHYISPWVDYLLVSKDEMHAILDGSHWQISEWIDDPERGTQIAIIKKNNDP